MPRFIVVEVTDDPEATQDNRVFRDFEEAADFLERVGWGFIQDGWSVTHHASTKRGSLSIVVHKRDAKCSATRTFTVKRLRWPY